MKKFINSIKREPRLQTKIKDIIVKCERLPYIYQSKIGYDTLIQNVILKEVINLMGTILVVVDIKLKMKSSGKKYFEIFRLL